MGIPEIRYTRSGDVALAYQVTGREEGPDLVLIPGWVSHVEQAWELPSYAAFLHRLCGFARLILFDGGTGLSDGGAHTCRRSRLRMGRHPRGDGRRRGGASAR